MTIKSEKVRPLVKGHLDDYARGLTNQPPMHGSRVITRILSDPELKKEWRAELKEVAMSIFARRQKLRDAL